MIQDMINLPDDVALVVLDMAERMSGPISPEEASFAIRMAQYLVPLLHEAFADAGIDPEEMDLPQIPLMAKHRTTTPPPLRGTARPGDLHQP